MCLVPSVELLTIHLLLNVQILTLVIRVSLPGRKETSHETWSSRKTCKKEMMKIVSRWFWGDALSIILTSCALRCTLFIRIITSASEILASHWAISPQSSLCAKPKERVPKKISSSSPRTMAQKIGQETTIENKPALSTKDGTNHECLLLHPKAVE